MKKSKAYLVYVALFALLNVAMYIFFQRVWIGGSSFLPMIGNLGKNNAFLYAFVVNIGVIFGAFLGALFSKEFVLRVPNKPKQYLKAVLGGILIGMGVTIAPGTCTTAFVTGMPMLSVSSFLSAAGIFIGAYIVYAVMYRESEGE